MFAKRLGELREKLGLTQKELSSRLGMARTTYSGYENGVREPDHQTLQKFADFFDVSIDSLMGRDFKYDEKTKDQSDFVLKELVEKYNVDLNKPGKKEKLEQLIKLVFDDSNN